MEVADLLDDLIYHQKQASYHHAQSLRALSDRKQQRCTGIDSEKDDMARLWAYLPANLATACYDRVDKIAKQGTVSGRSAQLDQIRADVVADLLLATPDKTSAVKVEPYVTVSAATLMGLSEQSGELAGCGPITPGLARELAADATWRRLLTDPISGEALEFATSTYRPPAALQRYIWARDRTCRLPGCMRPAHKSELDHTVPFPEGGTDEDNLGPFCRRHHRTKHRSAWEVAQPGTFTFRSPAGKTCERHPEPVLGDPPPFWRSKLQSRTTPRDHPRKATTVLRSSACEAVPESQTA